MVTKVITVVVTATARKNNRQVCLPRNGCPNVSGNDKLIRATFVGYDDDACVGNGF